MKKVFPTGSIVIIKENYGSIDLSQVKQIEVWYDKNRRELGFAIDGNKKGALTANITRPWYGSIFIQVKDDLRVSVISDGEISLLMSSILVLHLKVAF